jgi:hypothetical protein
MRKPIILTALAMFALLATVVPLLRAADSTSSDASTTAGKWEYARLTVATGEYTIETRDDVKTATSAKDLYFSAFGAKPGSVHTFSDATLLNRIGENGWELASTFAPPGGKWQAIYVFKRPLRQ